MHHVDWQAIESRIGRGRGESEKVSHADGPVIAGELIGREVLVEAMMCYCCEEQGARTAGVLLKWLKPRIIIDDIRDLIACGPGAVRARAVSLLRVVGEDDARVPDWILEYLSCGDEAVFVPAAEMLVYQVAVKARGGEPRLAALVEGARSHPSPVVRAYAEKLNEGCQLRVSRS